MVGIFSESRYQSVLANATDTTLVGTGLGLVGDSLDGFLAVPASFSPGAISIKDGGGSSITLFAGGASSLLTLHPFWINCGFISRTGAWSVTTGSNIAVVAVGHFR